MDSHTQQDAGLTLPADDRSAGLARRFTRRTLARWGYRGCHDEAILVVSELVTNAVRHGYGARTLRLVGSSWRIRVEVADGNPAHPAARRSGADGGWGIKLVDRLTAAWGVSPSRGGGKIVWCELAPAVAVAPEVTVA